MGWENRGNGNYYYRKKRVGNRVYSKYLGGGLLAELAAEMDEDERVKRAAEAANYRRTVAEQRRQIEILDEFDEMVRAMKAAALMVNGYHTHKGQWRKERVTN